MRPPPLARQASHPSAGDTGAPPAGGNLAVAAFFFAREPVVASHVHREIPLLNPYRRVGGSKVPRALCTSARGLPSLNIRLKFHSAKYA